ncbi:MAG: PilZ domain-containing protein [Pseudomonadota bacterium]|nr:PilZ domain-containing protein [Pseudomonadota bacterium]
MGIEKRTFFRFDVNLPYYLEPLTTEGLCFHIAREELISPAEYQSLLNETHKLNSLFQDERHIQNGGVQIFTELNQKLELMVWLLDSFIEGVDIHEGSEYRQRLEINRKTSMPEAKGSSKVLPLLQAFYLRLEDYISELVDVIEHSVHGKVFMYHKTSPKPFRIEQYISGLSALASKGNWLAQVITLMVAKLNHYESLYIKLKQAYQTLSDSEKWPIERVNLGAGGFAIYTASNYAISQQVCVLFKMDDEFVFARASCVYQSNKPNTQAKKRTAFQFDDLSSEDSAHIVRYLMAKELDFHGKTQ